MTTIHDVARHAGVSSTTVSRYLNRRILLPPATTSRIDAAIHALNYRANVTAKRLSMGRTETIGVVLRDIREPILAEVVAAIEDEADRHNYSIYLSTTRGRQDREIAAIERLHDRHVDGLIMMTEGHDDGTLTRLIGDRRQIVLLGEDIPDLEVPRVFLANEQGAYDATCHILSAGHRAVGFIGGPEALISVAERFDGFARAMRDHDLAIIERLVRVGSYEPGFGRATVAEFLKEEVPPTALLVASDSLVLGAILGLRDHGLRVPEDMSVVGFDDVARTGLVHPDLDSVRTPVDVLGSRAFLALHSLMMGETPSPSVRVPLDLVRRGSVAAPAQDL